MKTFGIWSCIMPIRLGLALFLLSATEAVEAEAIYLSVAPRTQYICVGGTATLTLNASDYDWVYPSGCWDTLTFTGWPPAEWTPSTPPEQQPDGSYSQTCTKEYDTPGKYVITVTAQDGGCLINDGDKQETVTVYVVQIKLNKPNDGEKLDGIEDGTGFRETRSFRKVLEAEVNPVEILDDVSVTFFYYGTSSGQGAGVRKETSNKFEYQWDITGLHTEQDSRMKIKARVAVADITCDSAQHVVCILKGEQIMELCGDWTHYPYHWAGKGPNECPGAEPDCADGCHVHEPYDNDHPSSGCHPCCYDCSGFAWKCLSYVGVSLPWGPASSQYTSFPDVGGNYKKGDLFFLSDGGVHHVMVSSSTGGSTYYHAPQPLDWTRSSSGGHHCASGPSGDGWCMDSSCSH